MKSRSTASHKTGKKKVASKRAPRKKIVAKNDPSATTLAKKGPTPVAIPDDVRRYNDAAVLIRGEAAVAQNGELPPNATHEIVGKNPDGTPKLVRRRYSLA